MRYLYFPDIILEAAVVLTLCTFSSALAQNDRQTAPSGLSLNLSSSLGTKREIVSSKSGESNNSEPRKRFSTQRTNMDGIPAFPSAEGYGAFAKGGRGGRIIEVTNLNDSGPGSFRAAVTANGPRIVAFRVGGTIELKSDIIIKGEDRAYLTIAGQTAPGGGILLKNYGFHIVDTHDIVVRFIRIRPGQWDYHKVWVYGILIHGKKEAYNIILDHISESWHVDDNGIWGNVHDVTLQWNIFAEGILWANPGPNKPGKEGPIKRGMGLMWGPIDHVKYLTVHHNLIINNYYRCPLIGAGINQLINNVIYNPGWSATHLYGWTLGFPKDQPYYVYTDIIGNYYKKGPDTREGIHEIRFETARPEEVFFYLSDNYGWNYNSDDPYAIVQPKNYNKRNAPLSPQPPIPVTVHSFEEAKNLVISNAGATLPMRDAVDNRLIHEFNTGTGHVDKGSDWPFIANGTPPPDSDHDGMPDEWEKLHSFNPNDPSDGPEDADGDGYTNVEEYLNELAGDAEVPSSFRATINAQPTSGKAPLTVQFTANVSGGVPPYGYSWTFGDGQSSTAPNPMHTFQNERTYTTSLSITDSDNKKATSSIKIDVISSAPSEPAVLDVRITEAGSPSETSLIVPGKWYDLYLYLKNWENIFYADAWLKHYSNANGNQDNRGGVFTAADNYVMSYSIISNTIWAKEKEGSADFSQITGTLGLYVDDDNNEYVQNPSEQWAKARFRLLENALPGTWTINAYVVDKNRQKSNLFQKSFQVVAETSPPTASISMQDSEITQPGTYAVILSTSKPVYNLPSPLIFADSQNSKTTIEMQGSVPGSSFQGQFVVDSNIANGLGTFSLPPNALVDEHGNRGNQIVSGKEVLITIANTPDSAHPNLPTIVNAEFTETNKKDDLSSILIGRWYDFYLLFNGWDSISHANVWVAHSSSQEGSVENQGGRFLSASNYVLKYAISTNQVFAKENEGSEVFSDVTGTLGLYVDDDNNEYEQNRSEQWAKARFKLLENALPGTWFVNVYLVYNNRQKSSIFQKSIHVDLPAEDTTPPTPPQNVRVHIESR